MSAKTYKAAQVNQKGGDFVIVDKPIQEPTGAQVRIKVYACGICRGDAVAKLGIFHYVTYPIVPGHECAGIVDAVGPSVKRWKVGQRVAVGWFGGACGHCGECLQHDEIFCESGKTCGISYDGGYGQYMLAPEDAVASIPDELSFDEAAPLVCAGVTVFNALRNSKALRPGDVVAILGIGGLGHLAVQFCKKSGYKTIAYTRGDKIAVAKELGADIVIDAEKHENVGQELHKLGGAKVILATAPNSKQVNQAVHGLKSNGEIIVLGVDKEPITVNAGELIHGNKSIKGWASGTALDSEETMKYAVAQKVKSINQYYTLDQINEAFDKMMKTEPRFRMVLKHQHQE